MVDPGEGHSSGEAHMPATVVVAQTKRYFSVSESHTCNYMQAIHPLRAVLAMTIHEPVLSTHDVLTVPSSGSLVFSFLHWILFKSGLCPSRIPPLLNSRYNYVVNEEALSTPSNCHLSMSVVCADTFPSFSVRENRPNYFLLSSYHFHPLLWKSKFLSFLSTNNRDS